MRPLWSPVQAPRSHTTSSQSMFPLGHLDNNKDVLPLYESKLLQAVTGRLVTQRDDLSVHQVAWLVFLQSKIQSYPLDEVQHLLRTAVEINQGNVVNCYILLTLLCQLLTKSPGLTIDEFLSERKRSSSDFSKQVADDDRLGDRCRCFLFYMLSALTMLYTASYDGDWHQLCLDPNQSVSPVHSQPVQNSRRPLCELLQGYAGMLPTRHTTGMDETPEPAQSPDALPNSMLNAKTLKTIGDVTIIWIDNISSHLEFDLDQKHLLVFKWPSFLMINDYNISLLARLLSDYYGGDFDRPEAFTCTAYLNEIRRSYDLLFADNANSRSYFNRVEKKRLKSKGIFDEYLWEICGEASPTTNDRVSYSKSRDFPILGGRLSKLQVYMEQRSPGSLKKIWQDDRNPVQWHTFWAVVWIGGFGIVLSLVQTALASVQVYYAMKGG